MRRPPSDALHEYQSVRPAVRSRTFAGALYAVIAAGTWRYELTDIWTLQERSRAVNNGGHLGLHSPRCHACTPLMVPRVSRSTRRTQARAPTPSNLHSGSIAVAVRWSLADLDQGRTRTTNDTGGPGLPVLSRARTVTVVSPAAKPKGRAMPAQNWMVLALFTNRYSPSGDTVQASADPRPPGLPAPFTNRQPRSLIAADMGSVTSKVEEAGTPPIMGSMLSHTAALPFPSARETMISRSGRTDGSDGE